MDYTPLSAPFKLVILPGILWLAVALELFFLASTRGVQEAVAKFIRRVHPGEAMGQ